jgi:DNA-binding MarR family transcriptional regulator
VPSPAPATSAERREAIDAVAGSLVPTASRLTRLLLRRAPRRMPRSEAGVLAILSAGPRRITELAELEGHAQPTITQLVKRMEERGWVARERDAADGRAVLVSITAAGAAALEDVRASYRAVLRRHLEALPDERIAALADATVALGALIDSLQQGDTE